MQTDIASGQPPQPPRHGVTQPDIVRAAKWLGGAMVLSSLLLGIGINLAASRVEGTIQLGRVSLSPVNVQGNLTVGTQGGIEISPSPKGPVVVGLRSADGFPLPVILK